MDKEILQSKNRLLNTLGLNANFLFGDFNLRYNTKTILKKNGDERIIRPPCKKLKTAQRKILDTILNEVELNDCVYGLNKEKGIRANALAHSVNYGTRLVNLDVTNFFPSINYKVVKQVFKNIGFSEDCANCLTKICTIDDSLPQGAPTSPYLSALAFKKIDQKIYDYARKNHLIYTRYFDDLTLSGADLRDKCIGYIENIVEDTYFELNKDKHEVFEPSQQKIVTGIVLTKSGLDISNRQKDKIKQCYRLYKKSLNQTHLNQYLGHLGFYLHINRGLAETYVELVTGQKSRGKRMAFLLFSCIFTCFAIFSALSLFFR